MSEPVASRPTPDWLGGSGLLPWSWAVERLAAERNYWIVTSRRDGFPQARPVWGVWRDEGLYLSVGHGGIQRTAARGTPAMPVTAHVDSAVDVVIVEGVIDRVAPYVAGGSRIEATLPLDDELLTEANRLYDSKYHYGPGSNWVNFLVRPRIVYGWRSEDVKTATRWTFPEQT